MWCIPVFLDEEIVHQYYNGYCNNILWPLFHYLGLPQEDRLATTRSFQSQFTAYKKANQMFADVVNEHYEEGDVVWCHDYHLMFLPKCLKDFHTYDYARHFVSACTRILGLEGTPEGVEDQGRLTRVAAFPIGIDSERFIRALEVPDVIQHMKELKERFAGRKVMLGVDRLDMIKGIPQKILAFEKFLEENASWRDKVVLLQIAVPTRTDNASAILASGKQVVMACVLLHASGFLFGYLFSRLLRIDVASSRTVSIEVGMQNSVLGLVLAAEHFGNPLTAVPCAVSSVCHSIIGSVLAGVWRRGSPKQLED
ncbi:hypothetical protein F2Q69_00051842 [Brassica cretica]|uniref:Trehalose-6-phosphate synthase n=1 Tax=Brassica cretica TaxID=69181 RepID=A0A8S9PSQ6_BRACR|nr:hypothetical protein F2Q69_00051842 [Brassica cretica]